MTTTLILFAAPQTFAATFTEEARAYCNRILSKLDDLEARGSDSLDDGIKAKLLTQLSDVAEAAELIEGTLEKTTVIYAEEMDGRIANARLVTGNPQPDGRVSLQALAGAPFKFATERITLQLYEKRLASGKFKPGPYFYNRSALLQDGFAFVEDQPILAFSTLNFGATRILNLPGSQQRIPTIAEVHTARELRTSIIHVTRFSLRPSGQVRMAETYYEVRKVSQ